MLAKTAGNLSSSKCEMFYKKNIFTYYATSPNSYEQFWRLYS